MEPIAARMRLRLGEGLVVGDVEELDRARGGIEYRVLRKFVQPFSRGIHGSGIDEVLTILPKDHAAVSRSDLANNFPIHLEHLLLVRVPEEADVAAGKIGAQVGDVLEKVLR